MEANNQLDNNDDVGGEPRPQIEPAEETASINEQVQRDCSPNDGDEIEVQISDETPSAANDAEEMNEIAEPLRGVRLENMHELLQGPFLWQPNCIVKTYCKQDIESLLPEVNESTEEFVGFQLRRFVIHLAMCYHYFYKRQIDESIKHLKKLDEMLFAKNYDEIFLTIHDALVHVSQSCHVYILNETNQTEKAQKIMQKISPFDKLDTQNQSGVWVIRSVMFSHYGADGVECALQYINEAIEIAKNPYWYFFKGKYYRLRRRLAASMTIPSQEEILTLETAYHLKQDDPLITVYIAEVYLETAKLTENLLRTKFCFAAEDTIELFKNKNNQLYEIAAKRFHESVAANTKYAHLLFRAGKGLMKLPPPHQDLDKAREILHKGLKLSPDSGFGNHAMAQYYDKYKQNYDLSQEYLQKALERKRPNFAAELDLTRIQFLKSGDRNTLLEKFVSMFEKYTEKSNQSRVLADMVSFHLFMKYDILKAIECMERLLSLKTDRDSNMNSHRCSFLPLDIPVLPLLDIILCDINHRVRKTDLSDTEQNLCKKFVSDLCYLNVTLPSNTDKNVRFSFLKTIKEGLKNVFAQIERRDAKKRSSKHTSDDRHTLSDYRKDRDYAKKYYVEQNAEKDKKRKIRQFFEDSGGQRQPGNSTDRDREEEEECRRQRKLVEHCMKRILKGGTSPERIKRTVRAFLEEGVSRADLKLVLDEWNTYQCENGKNDSEDEERRFRRRTEEKRRRECANDGKSLKKLDLEDGDRSAGSRESSRRVKDPDSGDEEGRLRRRAEDEQRRRERADERKSRKKSDLEDVDRSRGSSRRVDGPGKKEGSGGDKGDRSNSDSDHSLISLRGFKRAAVPSTSKKLDYGNEEELIAVHSDEGSVLSIWSDNDSKSEEEKASKEASAICSENQKDKRSEDGDESDQSIRSHLSLRRGKSSDRTRTEKTMNLDRDQEVKGSRRTGKDGHESDRSKRSYAFSRKENNSHRRTMELERDEDELKQSRRYKKDGNDSDRPSRKVLAPAKDGHESDRSKRSYAFSRKEKVSHRKTTELQLEDESKKNRRSKKDGNESDRSTRSSLSSRKVHSLSHRVGKMNLDYDREKSPIRNSRHNEDERREYYESSRSSKYTRRVGDRDSPENGKHSSDRGHRETRKNRKPVDDDRRERYSDSDNSSLEGDRYSVRSRISTSCKHQSGRNKFEERNEEYSNLGKKYRYRNSSERSPNRRYRK